MPRAAFHPWRPVRFLPAMLSLVAASFVPAAVSSAAPPPFTDALTEGTASNWAAFADGATASVSDDAVRHHEGAQSLHFTTDGGFDTWLLTPVSQNADWDLASAGVDSLVIWVYAENPSTGFQNGSPWVRLSTTSGDYIEIGATSEILNNAIGQWYRLAIPLAGNADWMRITSGSPDLAHVNWIEFHADTWDYGFDLWLDGLTFQAPAGHRWAMFQADPQKSGRADFTVPPNRRNGSFFDIFLWQAPTPGSPGDGGLDGTSMTFCDGAGPGGADLVVGTYHWPKGIAGLDRHTGQLFWSGNPDGGEMIGRITPAFSPDGATIYVVNDATEGTEYPDGHPLMGFSAVTGPSTFRHNGGDVDVFRTQMLSPTVWTDGRIFLHGWIDAPAADADSVTHLARVWTAATGASMGLGDPALAAHDGTLYVVAGDRDGQLIAWDGATGDEIWRVTGLPMMDASPTIDAANGRVYIPAGNDDVWIVGVELATGDPLWGIDPAALVYDYQEGVNNAHRAQATGCLAWDGATFYLQDNSQEGDGALFAIDTASGTVRWSYPTGSLGWEMPSSCPIVTRDSTVVVGNNDGGSYFALHDGGTAADLVDQVVLDSGASARASATLAPDGSLYLPMRTTWIYGHAGGGAPSFQAENLLCGIDLSADASITLPNPGGLRALAQNHAVQLDWQPIPDPGALFSHYAVYRSTSAFTSVESMTPIDSIAPHNSARWTDITAENGISYWYAMTTVSSTGDENRAVTGVGPRTPRDETDLQVAAFSRTPRYPRYTPTYTNYEISEPGGFGPYFFSAATGDGGQPDTTRRWPDSGQGVHYQALIRNRGTNAWIGPLDIAFDMDGGQIGASTLSLNLLPGETHPVGITVPWDGQIHQFTFRMAAGDARAGNDSVSIWSNSVPFLTYIDRTRVEEFREGSPGYAGSETDDLIDWLQRHMTRFNAMFAAAGCDKRVHYDILEVLDDTDPDPAVDTRPFAIFPFRYRVGEGDPRLSGYYDAGEDLDYGLLHEMGHQLGLIDIYRLNLESGQNQVSSQAYRGPDCLMNGVSHFLSEQSAHAMNHWLWTAHGYYGQYLYGIPASIRLHFVGLDGQPLAGAAVTMYQKCDRPGLGDLVTTQVKATGITDSNGDWVLPNVAIDTTLVPATPTGDRLRPNPFGYLAVVGSNGVLHFKVVKDGFVDHTWFDITEANNAYYSGFTAEATFQRGMHLGGPVQTSPPWDLAEANAASWYTWAEGGVASVTDDAVQKKVGISGIRFETNGGFDNLVGYPGDRLAAWDLSAADSLEFWVRADNPNIYGFQNLSPWIILKADDGYVQLHSTDEILNGAIGQWLHVVLPLDGNAAWERTVYGEPDLTRCRGIDIHADTWGGGFTLWLDGVRFLPLPVSGAPASAPPITALALLPPSPNPMRSVAELRFELPRTGPVDLAIFDAAGRRVRHLLAGDLFPAGRHAVAWDGADDHGATVVGGVYFARIQGGGETRNRVLVVVNR